MSLKNHKLVVLLFLFFTFLTQKSYTAVPRLPARALPVPIVTQATNYSCGAASLLAILYYWEVSQDYEIELHGPLKTSSDQGTSPNNIAKVARLYGLEAEVKEGLTIQNLKDALKKGITVIVDYQAWPDDEKRAKTSWESIWEDGHYSVLVAMDRSNVFLMDPSVIGSYSYIPIKEFLTRWHDYEIMPDGSIWKNYNLGILIKGENPIKKFPSKLVKTE